MPADAPPPNPPADSIEQSDESSRKTDWRLVAIVAIALLLVVAVYVNRRFYAKPPSEEQPAGEVSPETRPPPMSPVEQYANVKRVRELMAGDEVFHAGAKVYIVARPPSRVRDKDRSNALPGELFDVTRRIEGIGPLMLHRRRLFNPKPVPIFADTFPALGLAEDVKMVFSTATAEGVAEKTSDSRLVIGVTVGGEAKAYPLGFANFHDVINDTVGGKPILLCWSALAINASAMERPVANGTPDAFGSAGLLYQGAIVAYDARTRSLWSPLLRECIAGERAGETLPPVPTLLTSWKEWKATHPDALILTGTEPALDLPYDTNPAFPMPDYPSNSIVLYPAYGFDLTGSPMNVKTAVFGVTGPDGETVKAYALPLLRRTTEAFEDEIGGAPVVIAYDAATNVLTAADSDGKSLLVEGMFWMNWVGTHPNTEIWRKDEMPYPFAEKTEPAERPTEAVADPASVPGAAARPEDMAPEIPAQTEKDDTSDSD